MVGCYTQTNMTTKILNVHAMEILDSRGNPTIEVEITAEVVKSFVQTKIIKA